MIGALIVFLIFVAAAALCWHYLPHPAGIIIGFIVLAIGLYVLVVSAGLGSSEASMIGFVAGGQFVRDGT